ncbi:uncharacterized protein DEA37_0008286 [Paragonimus westermani]|uniref:Apyrase n=1 Tax=Paragonimus westermani TaxID=34504 RepID=A0A5J4N911_9TREM|nr:uncharacterized protein DEA37_0009989 [Paragonimus westermani]KAA3672866.1 uncharacterized protein DEA37_0008285 [Paragonimus westermani]KAA3672868.1 uncharacterized protein DEA37_0008286 [Paragonimus westermani]
MKAYSGFSFAMAHLFPNKMTGFTKSEVEDAVYRFCKKKWSQIVTETDPKQLGFVYNFCFDGIYTLELLTNFGFKTDESWKAITFGAKMNPMCVSLQINGQSVSWALGYMLDQSAFLPSESLKLQVSVPLFAALVVVSFLIIVASIVCLVFAVCISRKQSANHDF